MYIAKYKSLILLLLPLLFTQLQWYDHFKKTNTGLLSVSGIDVLFQDSANVLITYILCVLIQIIAIRKREYQLKK